MTKQGLLQLVSERPQAIWDILMEAAYFSMAGVESETFDKHEALLERINRESFTLAGAGQ